MSIGKKLEALRKKLSENNLKAYYITGSDAHQSEYVAPHWRTREFISGFTGSAGTVVVTQDKALLWVDSRYFIQAASEIKNTEAKILPPLNGCFQTLKKGIGLELRGVKSP